MEEPKEQKIKPPFPLTAQMFIYMVLVVLCIKKTVSAFPTYFYEDYYGIKTSVIVYAGVIDVFAYAYALVGIYRTLQRKSYGIAMLKLSLVYILMQLVFWTSSFLGTYPTRLFAIIWGIVILGGIIFLVYLFRSKGLKEYIPKSERKFGKYGWLGIIIYIAVLVQYGLYYGDRIIKTLNSQQVTNTSSKSGEHYTDGYVKFKPLADWEIDTIYRQNDKKVFVFSSPSHNKITIGTECMECKGRIDFYAVLPNLEAQTQLSKSPVKEVNYGTEYLNSMTLYYSTYTNESDSIKGYRTYAMFVDQESYKIMYIILDDTIWRKTSVIEELLHLSQSSTFQLE